MTIFSQQASGILKFGQIKPEFFHSERIKNISGDSQAAFYLIDKPRDIHSFKAVSILRHILQIKKVGFAGTLDPLASGLLILATGRATKLLDCFHYLPKDYQADVLFGQTSETYDLEGAVTINEKAQPFSRVELEKKLKKFIGIQEQTVPIYSAKKIAGHKMHELARRGQEVRAPQSTVEIYSLNIKDFNWPRLKLEVSCSAGTYIRSLAHDLGQVMGTGALLSGLRRVKIGDFNVSQALTWEELNAAKLAQKKQIPVKVIKLLQDYFFQKSKD
ncbi:MAG: tRNA pseudouridine(55) synthase TruB [Parcubacteria group bacterium]|nr:MAG: tRNA pseudouridine(55) synthase TruB [Parcubacteria group bacterium]